MLSQTNNGFVVKIITDPVRSNVFRVSSGEEGRKFGSSMPKYPFEAKKGIGSRRIADQMMGNSSSVFVLSGCIGSSLTWN
jgi:hypothetical protein